MPAKFLRASPYAGDKLDLPVPSVERAVGFYESVMGFRIVSRTEISVILERDDVQIGLAQNGDDPAQHGCFFEVPDVEAAFAELKSNGLDQEEANYQVQQHGETSYRLFFIVAPDGLCYCVGERRP